MARRRTGRPSAEAGRAARAGVRRRERWLALGVPFLLAVAAYAPTLGAGFVWDDVNFIVENPAARDLGRLGESLRHGYGWVPGSDARPDAYMYYRPVIVTANALHTALGGGQPWLFHLGNVLTHGLTAALLAAVALLLGLPAGAAMLAGSVHALHPVHTEAVAWISGRTDLTAALFTCAALALLLAARRTERRSAWLAPAAAGAALLAFLSKESAAALLVAAPLVLLLPPDVLAAPLAAAPAQAHADARRTSSRPGRSAARLAWLCLAAALLVYVVLRCVTLGSLLGSAAQPEGGVLASRGTLPERALLAGNLTLRYLLRLVIPWPLSIEAPAALRHPPYPLAPGLAGLALLATAWWLWARAAVALVRAARARSGGGTWRTRWASPPAVIGLGLFLAGLMPVLQWVRVGEVWGERFLYLPTLGLLLLAGALGAPWLAARARRPAVLLAVIAVPCVLLLQARLPDWRDDLALFQSEVRRHPDSARMIGNLGSTLMQRGRLAEAESHLTRAAQLDPEDARLQAQLGSLLIDLGRADEGVPRLERAAERMRPTKSLLKNLGIGWTRQGRFDEAAGALRDALARDPGDAGTLDALALAERKRGRLDEAAALFERALAIDPDRRGCYLNLIGLHYVDRRDLPAARVWGERFLARFPNAPEAASTRRLLAHDPAVSAP